MTDAIRWVGLDVHANQTTVAVIDKATGELQGAKLRGSPSMVLDFLARYDGRVIAVYEAGPTGMTLARQARARVAAAHWTGALSCPTMPIGQGCRRPSN